MPVADLTAAGVLGIIGLSTLLRSVMNGERLKEFIAGVEEWKRGHVAQSDEWKRGHVDRHHELERRIERVESKKAHD